jgi:hypothetical protein
MEGWFLTHMHVNVCVGITDNQRDPFSWQIFMKFGMNIKVLEANQPNLQDSQSQIVTMTASSSQCRIPTQGNTADPFF